MADRGSFRGGRGRGGGYARGGQRGGGAGGGAQQQPQSQQQQEKPKKENILDLSKYMDKDVKVKFSGGREGAHSSIVLLCVGWSANGDSIRNPQRLRPADEPGSR